jgi:RimJ/RimL family protein N-acetyltransferase
VIVATTERLVLRTWCDGDAEPFAVMNADPEVTRFLGGPWSREKSDGMMARSRAYWDEHGYGRAVVELDGEMVGFTGLGPHPAAPGEVEIGWRLARHVWGRGYATEAALAMKDLASTRWGLASLVSVAVPENGASLAVMRRLGMTLRDEVVHDGQRLVVFFGALG